ncbi:hypothetical protein, partial [Actinobacillus pleuropneumoniae]
FIDTRLAGPYEEHRLLPSYRLPLQPQVDVTTYQLDLKQTGRRKQLTFLTAGLTYELPLRTAFLT